MQDMPCDPTKIKLGKALKHTSPAISCRFDPSGRFVFFGAEDSRVWRWDTGPAPESAEAKPESTEAKPGSAEAKPESTEAKPGSAEAKPAEVETKTELAAHDSWVRAIAFDSGGETLITGGYDGRLIWWPAAVEAPQPVRTVDAHKGWIRAVAVSPDNQLLASVGNDKLVKLWSMADGQLVRQMEGHESHIYNVAFHPDGQRLVTGDLKGKLIDWQVADGSKQREVALPSLHKYDTTFRADIGGSRGMAFRGDGKLLACSGIANVTNAFAGIGNPIVEVVDWETGKPRIQYVSKAKLQGVGWSVRFHPDGFLVGISGGGAGGHVLFWKGDQKEEFHAFKLPLTARDMDLHPAGRHLVTAHYDGHVRILDM